MDTDPFEFEILCKAPPVPSGEPSNGRGKRKGETRLSTVVTLSIPTEEDECPLTLDNMSQSKLESLPDTTFCADKPLHKKLTLPCGHSFCAMVLIYNWCKNNMLCPCCRAGHQHRADPACLPGHFGPKMATQVQSTLEEERVTDDSSEFDFTISRLIIPFTAFALNNQLSLRLEFFDIPERAERPPRPIFTSNSDLIPMIEGGDDGPAFIPRGQLRTISHIMHMGVNNMRLSVYLNVGPRERMVIDLTPMVSLHDIRNNLIVVDGMQTAVIASDDSLIEIPRTQSNNTRFEIRFTTSQMNPSIALLNNVVWRPGAQRLELMSVGI
jgi:hypothetical protein